MTATIEETIDGFRWVLSYDGRAIGWGQIYPERGDAERDLNTLCTYTETRKAQPCVT